MTGNTESKLAINHESMLSDEEIIAFKDRMTNMADKHSLSVKKSWMCALLAHDEQNSHEDFDPIETSCLAVEYRAGLEEGIALPGSEWVPGMAEPQFWVRGEELYKEYLKSRYGEDVE